LFATDGKEFFEKELGIKRVTESDAVHKLLLIEENCHFLPVRDHLPRFADGFGNFSVPLLSIFRTIKSGKSSSEQQFSSLSGQ
jgi:hypothetical protein